MSHDLVKALEEANRTNEKLLNIANRATDLAENYKKLSEGIWAGIRLPKPMDVLVVKQEFVTLARVRYRVGDELILIEPTQEAPWGTRSAFCNWKVECRHFAPPQPAAIWSNIWMMLDSRTVEFK